MLRETIKRRVGCLRQSGMVIERSLPIRDDDQVIKFVVWNEQRHGSRDDRVETEKRPKLVRVAQRSQYVVYHTVTGV